jgi:phospholipid/cholesterol/gamma-HCH transport system permease protein
MQDQGVVKIKQKLRNAVEWVGELTIFMGRTIQSAGKVNRRTGIFINQCEFIGVSSLGILCVAAVFIGAVLGYQLYKSFELFGAQALVGGTLGVGIFREMAPVIGAIMVTGRAGAGIGAEIASMRVSEQIDALEVMGVNPYEYLVLPRVLAGAAMMPLLAFLFGGVSCVSAALISCSVLDLSYPVFWKGFRQWTDWIDLLHCMMKSISFGAALAWMGCFFGFRASGGARSVGLSTRSTVVAACLTILLLDYFWTMILPLRAERLFLK